MTKTKIICTIGPATQSYEMLQKMNNAGMDIARLNMSHGDHASHLKVINNIKKINKNSNKQMGILLDTQGPEIRTGDLAANLDLKTGSIISISLRDAMNVEETSIHINYDDMVNSVNVGDKITVDNGLINLEILEKSDRQMKCMVIDGGILKSKRHVNLPGIRVNLPAITSKDEADIIFGLKNDVDFIALSFVREVQDIYELKSIIGSRSGKVKIIAKIEDQEGVKNIDEIVEEADGIMVARGDLGVEINIEELPSVQREIVRKCAEKGRRVIIATHLLESMIENPIPTRAEVTDVANAVYEEVDAVMLSGETTTGKYPVKCVEYLKKIIIRSEEQDGLKFSSKLILDNDKQQLTAAAVKLAEALNVKGIMVFTKKGFMADCTSNYHPYSVNIYAFTNAAQTRRTLLLNRAVFPFKMNFNSDPEKRLRTAFNILKAKEGFVPGDKVVVISDVRTGEEKTDAVQIREVI
ncbi:MAG: pyruvate kinase [bacterium]|nr:pyruvate kinase [bacterium]